MCGQQSDERTAAADVARRDFTPAGDTLGEDGAIMTITTGTSIPFEILSNPYERMDYVQRTDALIAQLDGTVRRPDFVIYLDKSARPVAWLVRSLWDCLAAVDDSGRTVTRPGTLFVKIDGQLIDRTTNTPRDTPESLADLRSVFIDVSPPEGLRAMQAPSFLDGKEVLIVDEIQVSGTTLDKAYAFLKDAFPTTRFSTHAWMDERVSRPDGGVPPPPLNDVRWYERGNDRNRPVRETVEPEWGEVLKASDPRIRRGWSWLAKVPPVQEPGAKQLMAEIAQIGVDIRAGVLPYLPALIRPDDDERSMRFNGIDATDLYKFVRWAKQHYWANYNRAAAITLETGPVSPDVAETLATQLYRDDMQRKGVRKPRPFVYESDPRTPASRAFAVSRGFRDYRA